MSVQVEKRAFNISEYHLMSEAGILSDDDRVELIDGEVLKMSPSGKLHAACVKRLNSALNRKAGDAAIVSVQDPIQLDEYSEPQPDIALLKPRADFYAQQLPIVEDALLIVEVADSPVECDRNVKLPLYAKAGIPEIWLANLKEDQIETYSQPVNGAYQNAGIIRRGEVLSPETLPSLVLSIEGILG